MITFNKPNFSTPSEAPKAKTNLGATSSGVSDTAKKIAADAFKAEASNTGMRNTTISQMPVEVDIQPLLKDIVFSEDLENKKMVTRLYRDIYYNDPVGGSAVDLVTTMVWSDISLGGITDPTAERHFMETIERLNCSTLLPHASVDHLVDGTFLGSLLYNKSAKKFFDIMPHRIDNARVDSLPFFGQDPIITVMLEKEMRELLNSPSPRAASIRDRLGPEVVSLLSNDSIELDPLSTVYIPRRAFSTGEGVSWFRRLLPFYLIEKNLFRGTLVESSRRQRGILHVTLGDGDQWEPTRADMDFITELFMNADSDPIGAVIATRLGVATEELRQGGDFWKVTDLMDQTGQYKLRCLGMSESLLSGEQNLATADNNMTVFIEWLRSFRDYWTQKFFYNKIFPLVSLTHGYTVNNRGKLIRKDGLLQGNVEANLNRLTDSRLLIPTVHWSRGLKPEGDSTYMDMLNTLTDKGVPVPLRALAAAGGFNLDTLLADSNDNLKTMERVQKYAKELAEIKKKFGPQEPGDGESLSSAAMHQLVNQAYGGHSNVLNQGIGRHVGLSRDYGDASEITGSTRTGKKKMIHNQVLANAKANDSIRRALKGITQNKKTALTHATVTPKR